MTTSSTQAKRSRRRGLAICVGVLVAAGAGVGVLVLTSGPMSSNATHTASSVTSAGTGSAHEGMDTHAGMPASSPSPTGSADVPTASAEGHGSGDKAGEHGSGDKAGGHGSGDKAGDHGSSDMPGMSAEVHGKTAEKAVDRPLAPVLGTFGGGTSAVLLAAGLLRRKDRARSKAKEAARAARRAQS